jgi:hypothetical protein
VQNQVDDWPLLAHHDLVERCAHDALARGGRIGRPAQEFAPSRHHDIRVAIGDQDWVPDLCAIRLSSLSAIPASPTKVGVAP